MKYPDDFKNKILCGDTLTELKKFPDDCIDCVVTSPPYFNLRSYLPVGHKDKSKEIGLEKTYQEFIKKLIDVFDEVKRVLKKDGTCFVNLGDSYGGSGMGISYAGKTCGPNSILKGKLDKFPSVGHTRGKMDKCLMMIPERFAIAMIDKKWILRNKLVWIKQNAMPESVQDRWKKAHEYIFFFVKNKKYYFDLDKIRTPHKLVSINRARYEQGRNALGQNSSSMGEKYNRDKKHKDGTEKYYNMPARQVKLNPKGAVPPDFLEVNTNCRERDIDRNHYATFPQDLIIPLIKAGCPKGGIILDPFAGTCTTAIVAKQLQINYVMIELNSKDVERAKARIKAQPQPLDL